ncbi:MAG: hypothetical protein A3H33_10545 [Betaproteobacteria bacterium RIFCSPLOWO2_02_FULL_65_20]|nr:MAG: hypothetical protein A3H33_10545 [Betaproteobacteria bacterium RIFCSPLOWO2_02_FULL_65_20]
MVKHSEIPDPEIRKARQEYIEDRWRDLSNRQREHTDEAAKYLMVVNAGGAIATLSFMGAMKMLDPIPGARAMLSFFLAGLLLVGLGRALAIYRFDWTFSGWRDAVRLYYTDKIDWEALLEGDMSRSGRFLPSEFVAWASFACFITGLAIAYVDLLWR